MNRSVALLLIIFGVIQCTRKDSVSTLPQEADTAQVVRARPENDTVPENQSYRNCSCDRELEIFNYYTDLTISNNSTQHPFHPDSLLKWRDNPARLNVRSLGLTDFDTIPAELGIFENVESVYFMGINRTHIHGLEIFPQLRILKTEHADIHFNGNATWLRNLEVIYSNKTRFSGFTSFRQLPNLREVRLSFSGFDSFPADLEKLKCLIYVQIGAHTFGDIDLSTLDLSNLKCLRYIEFNTSRENIKGIPAGMDHIGAVNISHPNLTKTEKAKLKKFRSRAD